MPPESCVGGSAKCLRGSLDSVECDMLLGNMRDHDIGLRMLRSATGDKMRNQDQRSTQAAKVSKSNAGQGMKQRTSYEKFAYPVYHAHVCVCMYLFLLLCMLHAYLKACSVQRDALRTGQNSGRMNT